MKNVDANQVVASALWAAYGDALGFPTELVSEHEFLKRHGRSKVSEPIAWTRRVGGLFGPEVPFAVGTYSDDTQLRLSTSRAIRGDGYFDVESFAKVELPVWLNYALGAGRGSKAAAANLSLKDSTWSQNFFSSANSNYVNGGGNGAAMRIQPHVWANYRYGPDAFINDVVRNSVCTHGHPRAIIGAAIHAFALLHCLQTRRTLEPDEWAGIGESAAVSAYEALVEDEELSLVWLPNWERRSQGSLKDAWASTIFEWHDAVTTAQELCKRSASPQAAYQNCLAELGGFSNAERGSGLKSSLFAILLAWLYREEPPATALAVAANCFKSDTDTIATMAGALIGAVIGESPDTEIQDADYIRMESLRLYKIGLGEKQDSFTYPDLLRWTPPKNQSDAWQSSDGEEVLLGLGALQISGPEYHSTKGTELAWQWCSLPYGQTVLAKRRVGQSTSAPNLESERTMRESMRQKTLPRRESSLLDVGASPRSLDVITKHCIQTGFNPEVVGACLLEVALGPNGIENAVGFAAIIAKARLARVN